MQRGECRTIECKRVAQRKGLVEGYCCVICQAGSVSGFFAGKGHAAICDMIEEVGNAEVELGDNIILGYN